MTMNFVRLKPITKDNIKTDRKISKYKNEVLKILQVEMNDIKNVIGKFSVTDMWSVQYHKNDFLIYKNEDSTI